jgi:actin related protein 2/3 complex subunit 1A/1B
MTSLLFLNEGMVMGAGFDFNPALFVHSKSTGQWSFHSRVDREAEAGTGENSPTSDQSAVSKARELFKNKTTRGQEGKTDSDTLRTKHDRAITCLANATADPTAKITQVSSSGLDGRLVIWNLPSIEVGFANLGI